MTVGDVEDTRNTYHVKVFVRRKDGHTAKVLVRNVTVLGDHDMTDREALTVAVAAVEGETVLCAVMADYQTGNERDT